jgi:nicotinate-nucleotide pyrophosphorylase (carboxylating)
MPPPFQPRPDLDARLLAALDEDLGESGDATTAAIFDHEHSSVALLVAKAEGILAGSPVFHRIFELLDPSVTISFTHPEASPVHRGDIVARLLGPTRVLLAGERTALNLLQRLSGIATLTARFVSVAAGRCAVCDTRKTTPLWRDLEKYAVLCGGGTNHRMGLYDAIMIKDTHADEAGGLSNALARVRAASPGLPVHCEARDLLEVQAALDSKVDLLMLDNMEEETLRRAIFLAKGRVPIEITGGITLETLPRFASLGVDRVSVGALTHSAPAVDFSFRLRRVPADAPADSSAE